MENRISQYENKDNEGKDRLGSRNPLVRSWPNFLPNIRSVFPKSI